MMRTCTVCGNTKPMDQFVKSKINKGGFTPACRVCHNERGRQWAATNRHKTKLANRKSLLKKHYGMTLADYDSMLSAQSGQCAICGSAEPGGPGDYFHIDHDHETGAIRALLCSGCNLGIGSLGDDPDRVLAAAMYLFTHCQDELLDV